MKKLLLGSVVLLVFSLSVLLFQASCKKEAVAQNTNYVLPPATTTTLGGVIVGSGLSVTNTGILSVQANTEPGTTSPKLLLYTMNNEANWNPEFWVCNLDGTNKRRIPVTVPAGFELSDNNCGLSSDGKTLFYRVSKVLTTTPRYTYAMEVYSCSLDGTNVKKIIDNSGMTEKEISIQDIY